MLDECTTELFLSLLSTIFPTVCMHTWAFMETCFTRATVKEIVITQSRNQSPQASWTVGGRWNRLWGNGKKAIILIGCSKAVHLNLKTINRRISAVTCNSITPESLRATTR